MIKRSPSTSHLPDDWTVTYTIRVNGRNVAPGTELSIVGVRGRVTFLRHVQSGQWEWIDVIQPGRGGWRSFRPDQIRTVHHRKGTTP